MCSLTDPWNPSRREFVHSGLGAAAMAAGFAPSTSAASGRAHTGIRAAGSYLEVALEAARWIEASRVVTPHGVTWPADPATPESLDTTLYQGCPGVVLFFLDLYHATGDESFLDSACAGADHLSAQEPVEGDAGAGLYTGLAGIAFCLEEAHRASGRAAYRTGAERCLTWLQENARPAGAGVAWNSSTDIISGSAGIGLTLLYAARAMAHDRSLELAAGAGRHLLSLGRPEAGGLKWPVSPEFPRLYPNFSHGTAGVCYFLASLYGETGEREFRDGAVAGARYLQAVARTDGDTLSVFHNEPDGLDLYYLSWCHGPPGTARLFYRLAQVTGNEDWMLSVQRCARAITQSGIPEQHTPGFWNNVSKCCGNVGVGEFFLDLYRVTGESAYLDFTNRVTDDLKQRATEDASGIRWVQAEHRTRPELLVAQTGYMQGAAGIGSYFLRLHGQQQGQVPAIVLPDSPF